MKYTYYRFVRLFQKQTTTTGFNWRLDIYGSDLSRMAGVR